MLSFARERQALSQHAVAIGIFRRRTIKSCNNRLWASNRIVFTLLKDSDRKDNRSAGLARMCGSVKDFRNRDGYTTPLVWKMTRRISDGNQRAEILESTDADRRHEAKLRNILMAISE